MMTLTQKTYFDFAASTPVKDEVLEAMNPFFQETFGNSSAVHIHGQKSEAAVENSRRIIAEIFNCQANEIIFTSGGTESNNLAIRGTAFAAREKRDANHILISPVEHHSVSETVLQLQDLFGFKVELLPVDKYGLVDPSIVAQYLRPSTALVSVIYGNNEIGSINPITAIGEICQANSIPFHTDAVQFAAHNPIDLETLNVDLLSIGAHKFYGPKGVGALYLRMGTKIYPTQTGGGQEFGLRSGTPNVPYIVGQAEALRLTQAEFDTREDILREMRDYLIGHVLENISDSKLTGHPTKRLSNHASFVFRGVDGNMLLPLLDNAGFSCSSGSACKTGDPEPSETLRPLGLSPEWAFGSLRVSLGHTSTPTQVEAFLDILPGVIKLARNGAD